MKATKKVGEFVWKDEESGFFGEGLRLLAVSIWKFRRDDGTLRASALTYTTALSIVPFLAITFSMLKGLGVQKRLEPKLLEFFASGHKEVATKIMEYVDRTNVGALGVVGLIALILTAISLLGSVERSFNTIWGVEKGRTALRKVTDYTALMLGCPVLLLLSTSISTTGQIQKYLPEEIASRALPLLFALIPFLAKAVAFAAMYLIMPNRRVSLKAAITGGIVAGLGWQATEWIYIRFQVGVTKYNAIYGAMAQLPLFLIWMYMGWCIILIGAQVACILELPGRGRALKARLYAWMPRPGVFLPVLREVGRRFESGTKPLTIADLASETGISTDILGSICENLSDAGYISLTDENPPRILPSISPTKVSMGDLVSGLAAIEGQKEYVDEFMGELSSTIGETTWAEWAGRDK